MASARLAPTGFGPSALATPANAVTVARLVATPLMVVLIAQVGPSWSAVGAWFLLSCTDGLDGYLARRHGATRSGAFLDPLADKICVLAAMATLVAAGRWWWPAVALIAGREAVQTVWRVRLGRRGISVPATRAAKVKTLLQDLAVGGALLPWTANHHGLVQTVLWLAVLLTVVTGVQYLMEARRVPAVAATA
ncbi:MAG TPA: CDP-alcohol phosphatidyltransferase family protein [Acidimicrobiales bacterium]